MADRARSLLARFIAAHLPGPSFVLIHAWLWLAAKADDLEEKRRCLNAVLRLDPENEPPSLALLLLDQKRPDS